MNTHTMLADLPQFTVTVVMERDGQVQIAGRFSHLRGVRAGRSWLYVGADTSIIGDTEIVDPTTASAVFITDESSLREPAQVGAVFPWIEGYWQPYHVSM